MFPPPQTPPLVPQGNPEPLTLTHGAIGQLEALGTEALVGASHVFTLASHAAVLGVFTLIHICRVTQEEGSQWQHLPRTGTSEEVSRRLCMRSLAPQGHHPLTKQHTWEKLVMEPLGSRVTPAPSTLSQLSRLSPPLAGLLQLCTQCPPWGQLAFLSNPGLRWPNTTTLMA